ncbi:MAG: hypothetical protein NT007_06670 [Candidatus Kapabacteria bacterium]|nr:hypothetical protein [Candidatus Kapabacteria bacterium]
MKKLGIITVAFFIQFVLCFFANAETYIRIALNASGKNGDLCAPVYVGIADHATYDLDDKYNEFEIVQHPPQPSLDILLKMVDSATNNIRQMFVYTDIRPVMKSTKFMMKYRLDAQRGTDGTLLFNWNQLPESVDSAIITDIYGLNLFYANMSKITKVEVTSPYMDEFDVFVWYNLSKINVNDLITKNISSLQENNHLMVDQYFCISEQDQQIENFKIFDFLGNEICEKIYTDRKIYIGDLQNGVYFITLKLASGQSLRKCFMKS